MNNPNDTSNWHEYRTLFGYPIKLALSMAGQGVHTESLDITDALTVVDDQLHIDNDKVLTAIKEHRYGTVEVGEGRNQ